MLLLLKVTSSLLVLDWQCVAWRNERAAALWHLAAWLVTLLSMHHQEGYELKDPLRAGGSQLLAANVARHWRLRRMHLQKRAFQGLRVGRQPSARTVTCCHCQPGWQLTIKFSAGAG